MNKLIVLVLLMGMVIGAFYSYNSFKANNIIIENQEKLIESNNQLSSQLFDIQKELSNWSAE